MSASVQRRDRRRVADADAVAWHDLECGDYDADLAVWLELAATAAGPVLDVGAGSGRVSVALARAGHAVVALDRDPVLLEALSRRAADLEVQTVCADARDFSLDRRFPLIVVPMQTIQLLDGSRERGRFLERARAHLAPGGTLAAALLPDVFEEFDATAGGPAPDADELTRDGVRYSSRPTVLRRETDAIVIERVRERHGRRGAPAVATETIRLDRVTAAGLVREARELGFSAEPLRHVPETAAHVGSEVVVLRA